MCDFVLYYNHDLEAPAYQLIAAEIAENDEYKIIHYYDEFAIDIYLLLGDPEAKTIAFDWDNTVGADPVFFSYLIDRFRKEGYDPVICSLRGPGEGNIEEMYQKLGRTDIEIHLTDGEPKIKYMQRHKCTVNLWIDDFFPAICKHDNPLLKQNKIDYGHLPMLEQPNPLNIDNKQVIDKFLNDEYEQIICDKCMNTFFTNIFNYSDTCVLLEKRALGLEYFCHAIHEYGLSQFPNVTRVGLLDENDNVVEQKPYEELFDVSETEYRYLYVMEKMEHLSEEEAGVFNELIKDLDWKDEAERDRALSMVAMQFGKTLRREIELLFNYYQQHKDYILWDLHGDNLMKKIGTKDIVVLDPFAINVD